MSEEQLKAFLEKVQGDTSLQEKLKAAADANDANAVVEIAKEAGFSISADEINQAQSELSDKELEGVAGGDSPTACVTCALLWIACPCPEIHGSTYMNACP